MKVTLQNIENAENGYIGTIVEQCYEQTNLLNQCYKTDTEIRIEDGESKGYNYFTIEEFAIGYKNKELRNL